MTTNLSIHRNFIAPALIAVFLAVLVAGCASPNTAQVKSTEADRLITDIVSREDAASLSVTVKGSQQLTYTAVKQDAPLGVLFLFPDTGLDNLKEVYYPPENETISSIRASEFFENGRTSRIFISLKGDVAYELSPEGADLTIVFPKAGAPTATASQAPMIKESDVDKAAAQPPAPKSLVPATALVSVNATPSQDGVVITIEADGALKNYKSFTLSENPPRIVFDFAGIRSPYKGEQRLAVKTGPVSQVRHLAYPDKVRLVVETQKPYLGNYAAEVVDNGLLIQVGDAAVGSKGTQLKLASGPAPSPPPQPSKPAAATAGSPAWVNRVEFADEEAGKSAVLIGTTRPVSYDLVKSADKQVQLKLVNTQVPEQYKRAVITTRFESAVDRVTPTQGKNETLVAVDLRENVPYTAEQMGNLIRLNFAASAVPPKPYESAEPPAWKTAFAQAPAAVSTREPAAVKPAAPVKTAVVSAAPKSASSVETGAGSADKVYTGEKIALDFYDTDIKNVFRILQEISGKNFAIDKNVTGKVTLALQKPVPWDQVLDLVLKMNQLGMVREGDIIRIASLATLQQEEKMRQAQLKAEQDAKKQEEEGEPLITEYIPVNYSAAKTDVLPHVANILTPNRGKASVDERNNQLIITDILEKVRQARAIVSKIDRVTPQVIIEARVVEANSSFSREVGFDWGTISVEAFKIGGALKTGPTTFTSNNIPSSFKTDNTIGFNFSTLFGTNISIVDAKLTASEVEGKANIISSPKIITLNGRKATIKQGLEVPYLERDSSGNATVRFKNVDLLLDVTPNISQDKRIVMSIFITKNDVVDPTAPEPALSTNEAKTEILVEDGDTIVIGGVLKDSKRMADQGIPGLRKLPALGWLFRADKMENNKSELLIFITPRIIQLEQRKTI
jgi:type IV pilus assembly protein PilQ